MDKLRVAAGPSGPGGIFTLALSAIDIALWDIKGKALNLPVATLAGGHRDARADLRERCADAAVSARRTSSRPRRGSCERGFRQMKMQLALPGDTSPEREVERTREIRARRSVRAST